MQTESSGKLFYDKEKSCLYNFNTRQNYWHLCTPGMNVPIIFTCQEDFEYGMCLMAICAYLFQDISVYTFVLMNTHVHLILSGEENRCKEFFDMFSRKLRRYLCGCGRSTDLSGFRAQLIPITDLQMLRNEIIYVNRNGYVANSNYTPYSYPWGAGMYFFNPLVEKLPFMNFERLTVRKRRKICRTKVIDVCHGMKAHGNIILPTSFCKIKDAESMYRDASHYFASLTRNHEAFSEIARRLGDTMFLPDSEMYQAISSICNKKYGIRKPSLLSPEAKIEIARMMHYEYHASNRQIRSILNLDMAAIEEMFPTSL